MFSQPPPKVPTEIPAEKDLHAIMMKVKEEVQTTTEKMPDKTQLGEVYHLSILNTNSSSSLNFTVNLNKLNIKDIIFTPVNDQKDFNVTFRVQRQEEPTSITNLDNTQD